jgi:TM2 domain-containing membrane protein YozV
MKKRTYVVAVLLSFFLGCLGVDRFYLGYTGLGILKLLTLGGLGVWALIDFILIAVGKLKDADGNALEK